MTNIDINVQLFYSDIFTVNDSDDIPTLQLNDDYVHEASKESRKGKRKYSTGKLITLCVCTWNWQKSLNVDKKFKCLSRLIFTRNQIVNTCLIIVGKERASFVESSRAKKLKSAEDLKALFGTPEWELGLSCMRSRRYRLREKLKKLGLTESEWVLQYKNLLFFTCVCMMNVDRSIPLKWVVVICTCSEIVTENNTDENKTKKVREQCRLR